MSNKLLIACIAGVVLPAHADMAAAGSWEPTDPGAPVPWPRYQSVMSGYEFQPVQGKPANWRELNDRMEKIGGPAGQLRDPSEPIEKNKN